MPARRPRLGSAPIVAAAFAATLLAPAPVAAADAPAPSQRLEMDRPPPRPALAGSGDVLGPVFGRYEARLAVALAGWHGVAFDVGAGLRGGAWRARALFGWQVWLLGRGLEGPWLGLAAGVAAGPDAAVRVPALAEAGYQGVWGDVAIALAVVAEQDLRRGGVAPRLRVALRVGWVVRGGLPLAR